MALFYVWTYKQLLYSILQPAGLKNTFKDLSNFPKICENEDMDKRKRRGKKIKLNIFKILSIFLIIIFLGLTPVVIKKIIIIKNITCTSQYGECPENIGYKIQNSGYRDLQNTKKQLGEILENSYLVESFLVQYQIPSTLKIDLVLKKPKFAIKNSNIFFLIDKNGFILDQKSETNLPFIILDNFESDLGQKVSSSNLFFLNLLYQIDWLYKVGYGEVREVDLYVKLKSGPSVIFPGEGNIKSLIGSLRLIYSRLNENDSSIKMENVSEIDLRFDNPILR